MPRKLLSTFALICALSACNVRFESSSESTSPFRPENAPTESGAIQSITEMFRLYNTDLRVAYKYLSYRCQDFISGAQFVELMTFIAEDEEKKTGIPFELSVIDVEVRNIREGTDSYLRADVKVSLADSQGDSLPALDYRPMVYQDSSWRSDDCDGLFAFAKEVYNK